MTHRAYQRDGNDGRLDSFRDYDRSPNAHATHKGKCKCGVETARYVTAGPPGDPRNGFECRACGEAELRRQFASQQVDRYLRKSDLTIVHDTDDPQRKP